MLNSKIEVGEFTSFLGSAEGAIFLLGKLCILLMVVSTIHAFETLDHLNDQVLPSFEYKSENLDQKKEKQKFEQFAGIKERNLFNVAIEKESGSDKSNEAPVAKIKMRLVGTSVTTGATPFAILENDKGDQDVFDLNELAFDQAKIVEITQDNIKIEYGGRTETLSIEETEGGGGGSEGIQSTDSEGSNFSVPEAELNDALANLPRLLSQARAVPYFRNGQSIGMRLFAIRSGSLYEKLGLKNGDILMSVNNNSLSDPTQALKIFEQLKTERSISLKVERSGEEKQLQYSIN